MIVDKILSVAQMFLTPKLGADKASQACNWARQKFQAGNYGNGKADLLRALHDSQVTKNQFGQMMGMLNNPVANSVLGMLSPNLASSLKQVGQEISGEIGGTPVTSPTAATTNQGVNNEFPPLRKR